MILTQRTNMSEKRDLTFSKNTRQEREIIAERRPRKLRLILFALPTVYSTRVFKAIYHNNNHTKRPNWQCGCLKFSPIDYDYAIIILIYRNTVLSWSLQPKYVIYSCFIIQPGQSIYKVHHPVIMGWGGGGQGLSV